MEPIAWSKSENVYYDKDWGFLAAILACYNNHWVLRTTPDDWWTIIARNIAQRWRPCVNLKTDKMYPKDSNFLGISIALSTHS